MALNKNSRKNVLKSLFSSKKSTLLVFILIFAGIGSYLLLSSRAAYNYFYLEQNEYSRINFTRAASGLGSLASRNCLALQARAWAAHMASVGTEVHSNLTSQYGSCTSGNSTIGENVGKTTGTYSSDLAAEAALYNAFLASASHKANILGRSWNSMGVGVAKGSNGNIYIVQAFATDCVKDCGPATGPATVSKNYVGLAFASGATSGFKIDNFGDVDGYNRKSIATSGYWPNQDVVRAASANTLGRGYKLDKFGGLWPFNGAPASTGAAYWPNFDIARDVKLVGSTNKGFVLDGYGGLHAFNGAGKPIISAYWSGKDLAKRFAVNRAGTQGYVMDIYGGLHPFSTSGTGWPPAVTNGPYWPGNPVAREVVLRNDGNSTYDGRQGYILDAAGGITPFSSGNKCKPAKINSPFYQPNFQIATDIEITSWGSCTSTSHGYLLTINGSVFHF